MHDVQIEATGSEVRREAPRPRHARDRRTAGALLALAGIAILMGIITAEALYPARYTTVDNEISDLGATRPPNSVILQPSAAIFDTTMIVTGLAIVAAAAFARRAYRRRAVTVPVFLMGLGVLGVGIFPGNRGAIHQLFAMLAFFAGGLSGLLAATVLAGPARVISRALGGVSLLTLLLVLFLGEAGPLGWLGDGGAERWVAYPVVLWMVVFGGYLMAAEDRASRPNRAAST